MLAQAQQLTQTLTPTGHVTPARLPLMRAALHDGAIELDHVDVVVEVMKELPGWASTEDRELVESTLAGEAREVHPPALRRLGQHIRDRLDQDGSEPNEAELAETVTKFRYRRTPDGGMELTAKIDREAAEELEGMILALSKPQP